APEQVTSPLQPTIPPASQTTPTTSIIEQDTAAIKTVISEFYTAYTSCLSQPPAEARGRVSLYCQEEIAFTTDAFLENLQENKATLFRADPVLCSQNTGGSTSVETVDYEDPQRAVATVVLQSGNGFAQKI